MNRIAHIILVPAVLATSIAAQLFALGLVKIAQALTPTRTLRARPLRLAA